MGSLARLNRTDAHCSVSFSFRHNRPCDPFVLGNLQLTALPASITTHTSRAASLAAILTVSCLCTGGLSRNLQHIGTVALLLVATMFIGCASQAASAQQPPPIAMAYPYDSNKALTTSRQAGYYAKRASAMSFATDWALNNGAQATHIRAIVGSAQRLPSVIKLVSPAPNTFKKDWRSYRARFIEPVRLAAGRSFWQHNAHHLEQAEVTYGVPAWLIVGVIGVESIYGRHTGSYTTLDVLTTLAFDFPKSHPKWTTRQAFFRDELSAFLQLASTQDRKIESWVGSYAGALGWPQFMPSSWQQYAIDFDGDGHIDLINNQADIIGSVANYFKAFGWQTNMPTHFKVTVDQTHAALPKLLEPDIVPTFTANDLHHNGAALGSDGLAHRASLALVLLKNAKGPPTYVAGTHNFYVVTRYNWSSYYALAVIELGQAIQDSL
jgi:membrane-bound lytic murein transglycosylase B